MLTSSFPHHYFVKREARAQEKALNQASSIHEEIQVLLNAENKKFRAKGSKEYGYLFF